MRMSGLAGKSVLVTRAADASDQMVALLESRGARAVILPTISIVDPDSWDDVDSAIARLDEYDGVFFTSKNAVERFLRRVEHFFGSRPSRMSQLEIYAVGEKTEEALEQAGVRVTFTPDVFSAEALAESMADREIHGKRYLFPRSNIGSDVLPTFLRERGATVDEIIVYKNVPPQQQELDAVRNALLHAEIDVVTFFSPSAVRNFLQMMGSKSLARTRVAVIGPSTQRAAESAGLSVDIVARHATAESLVETIAAYFQQPSDDPSPVAIEQQL
jgi:uroporphyrinogen III methyltransferase/synthase